MLLLTLFCLLHFSHCLYLHQKKKFWKRDLTDFASPSSWSANTYMFCFSYQYVKPQSFSVFQFLPSVTHLNFLLQFGIKSAVLNAELPQNSRLHILEVCFYTHL